MPHLFNDWRGNLRELRNFVTWAIIMGDQDGAIREIEAKIAAMSVVAGPDRLQGAQHHHTAMKSLVRGVKNRTEMQMTQDALDFSCWNRRRVAESLNFSYRGLFYKICQHRLPPRPPVYSDEATRRRYLATGKAMQRK